MSRLLTLGVLSIALALGWMDRNQSHAAYGNAQTIVAPLLTPALSGTLTAVNNGPGNQTKPHVDRDRVSFSNNDFAGSSLIHLFDFSTGTDSALTGNGLDRLSDVAGIHVAFTELTALGDQVVVFDTTSQMRNVVSGFDCSNPGIGGNLVAFEDRSYTNPNQSEINVYDLSTGLTTRLTNDPSFDKRPAVDSDGNTIVWEKCVTDGEGCDIYSAVQTSPGVFSTRALTAASSEDHDPDTNGDFVVYTSIRGGETDVYFQPVGGGTETQIALPGDQRDVRMSENLIVFESETAAGYDIFTYDINTGNLYRITDTPNVSETLSDISVWNGTGRIVFSSPGAGDFDVYAFTFPIPNSVASDINNLIALVRSFHLAPGIERSLLTKLQSALAALSVSDTVTACDSLGSFINECSAKSGKELTAEQASELINAATQIRVDIGCQ